MSRWYDEDIWVSTVRRRLDEDPAGESPERFVWQGRLYVVTEIQASWRERQPWWVLCEDTFSLVPVGGAGAPGDRMVELLARSAVRRCWRVRARNGAQGEAGTYELARVSALAAGNQWRRAGDEQIVGARSHSGTTPGGGLEAADVAWRLMRVGD